MYDALFVVNDSPELAVRVNADGVHVGQDDVSVAEARWMVSEARRTDAWPCVLADRGTGGGRSVIVYNLPAAILLASITPAHPRALLLGLNLGPNLAVTGSLSAVLWMRVATATGSKPSALTYSKLGLIVVPYTVAAGLAALAVFAPTGLPL